jgi:hypothetical protein
MNIGRHIRDKTRGVGRTLGPERPSKKRTMVAMRSRHPE